MIDETTRVIIVVVALTITILSFIWRKRNSERKKENSVLHGSPFKKNTTNEQFLNYHEKENDILLRIAQAEREFNAKVDSKITLLNVLIENADKSIKELKALQEGKPKPEIKPASLELPKQEQLQAKIKQLHEAGLSSSEIANHLKMMEGEVNLTLSILKKKYDG